MPRNLAIAVVAIALIGGGYLLKNSDAPKVVTNTDANLALVSFEPRTGEIDATGVLDCTPHKSGKPVAEGECVMGLKADDGKFYSLDTSKMEDAKGSNLEKVRVLGTFVATDAENPEVGDYAYDGVITVRAIEAN
ncbi:MAG TPA: hypothetical protein PLD99_01440 [Parcubacteria group bacterium]|nr:hypothetical protein [Parcubacteria group bacterium]